MMLLGDPEEYGLPPKNEPLIIIKNHRLAPKFNVFESTSETIGEDNHEKFVQKTMRWNGHFYQ